ncbi:MAG: hypothetical protein V4489_06605 [Chlamydiota bacterium]
MPTSQTFEKKYHIMSDFSKKTTTNLSAGLAGGLQSAEDTASHLTTSFLMRTNGMSTKWTEGPTSTLASFFQKNTLDLLTNPTTVWSEKKQTVSDKILTPQETSKNEPVEKYLSKTLSKHQKFTKKEIRAAIEKAIQEGTLVLEKDPETISIPKEPQAEEKNNSQLDTNFWPLGVGAILAGITLTQMLKTNKNTVDAPLPSISVPEKIETPKEEPVTVSLPPTEPEANSFYMDTAINVAGVALFALSCLTATR